MRPFTSTISIDEARRRLAANVQQIERTERVPLSEAFSRVAAADVSSTIWVPPFNRSAMDGYAVRAADTAGADRKSPARLHIVDRIYTGAVSRDSRLRREPARRSQQAGRCRMALTPW